MRKKLLSIAALAVLILSACAEGNEKQTFGTIIGAGVGAVLGAQVGKGDGRLVGITLGALGGGWLGSEAGKALDEADRLKANQTAQNALESNPSGQALHWNNPDSGHSGSTTPTSVKKVNGKDCRDFESTITIDGKTEPSTGRACRDSNGSWQIVPQTSGARGTIYLTA